MLRVTRCELREKTLRVAKLSLAKPRLAWLRGEKIKTGTTENTEFTEKDTEAGDAGYSKGYPFFPRKSVS